VNEGKLGVSSHLWRWGWVRLGGKGRGKKQNEEGEEITVGKVLYKLENFFWVKGKEETVSTKVESQKKNCTPRKKKSS